MMSRQFRKRLARAIIIDRATPGSISVIGRVARERTEENYRFASRFVNGKAVLDIGGGMGIGHDLLLAGGAASILSLDRHVAATALEDDRRVRSVRGDFLTHPLPDGHFDVVICLGTLFYLRDCDAALARMHRLLKPAGTLIINCINQRLIRRYFNMPLEEIDDKFSTAYDESGFCAFLKQRFDAEPAFYVQQPVPVSRTLSDALSFWLIPLTWPLHRHPIVRRPPGTEGMYLYAVVSKNG
jgi:ubiquinone/menaquinone biosynthesis C-methylase UbiE